MVEQQTHNWKRSALNTESVQRGIEYLTSLEAPEIAADAMSTASAGLTNLLGVLSNGASDTYKRDMLAQTYQTIIKLHVALKGTRFADARTNILNIGEELVFQQFRYQ